MTLTAMVQVIGVALASEQMNLKTTEYYGCYYYANMLSFFPSSLSFLSLPFFTPISFPGHGSKLWGVWTSAAGPGGERPPPHVIWCILGE